MILFIALLIILSVLVALAIAVLSIGGVLGVILFGDLIVCIAVIVWIIHKIWKR